MNANNVSKRDMLDILFATRNKAYGAYYLRRTYGNRVVQAVLSVVGVVFLLSLIFFATQSYSSEKHINDEPYVLIELDKLKVEEAKPKRIEVVKPAISMPKPQNTISFRPPNLKKNEEVVNEEIVPENNELDNKKISNVTKECLNCEEGPEVIPYDGPGGETVVEVIPTTKPEDDKVLEFVEVMPMFFGGEAALRKFLLNNIEYPSIDRENGVEGVAVVSFIVEKDGSLSHIECIRSPSSTISKEAVRVAKLMPAWTPGNQNGKTPRVKMKMPIKFTLAN